MGIRTVAKYEFKSVIDELITYFEQEVSYFKKPNTEHLVSSWKRMLDAGFAYSFAAFDDGTPVGILLGMVVPELFTGELQALEVLWYVRLEFRAKYALPLLKRFEDLAKEQGCKGLVSGATVAHNPKRMARLYNRLGFQLHGSAYRKAL